MWYFLNYVVIHPDASIQYHASGMILHMNGNTSYLLVRKSRSRAGGGHYLIFLSIDTRSSSVTTPQINGQLHVVCSIMKNVVASVVEVEMGDLFINGQEVMILRIILEEMSHP